MKIFIADDSILVRERLAALISELQAVELVGQAGDVDETLGGIRQSRPDVVILDIRMPGGNGIQVLEAIKTCDVKPAVIMFTAFPFPQYRQKCLELGADYFLDKTMEFDRVAHVLEQLHGKIVAGSHQPQAEVETN